MEEYTFETWPGTVEQNIALQAYYRGLFTFAREEDRLLNQLVRKISSARGLKKKKQIYRMYKQMDYPLPIEFVFPWKVVSGIKKVWELLDYFELQYPQPPEVIMELLN